MNEDESFSMISGHRRTWNIEKNTGKIRT
jgi:hypothetical protein